MAEFASALPTKQFFLDMLTRDISLEDAILDLVDNCIDSLARHRNLPLDERLLDSKAVERALSKYQEGGMPRVAITLSKDEFCIEDNCGGIEYQEAKEEVFRFGRVAEEEKSRLSVYGIGLKRAIFKLGRDIVVESHTTTSGFIVRIDATTWEEQDDWHFPLEESRVTKSDTSAGTKITVRKLNADVKMRIDDGQLLNRLQEFIASAYALLLERFVNVSVNGQRIKARKIALGSSSNAKPAQEEFDVGDVHVTLVAGLAERVDGEWSIDRAGWYVFCNGRVVLSADKSEASGWGINSPQFVSKYRGFVGLAFFFSKDPESLPWTTTKRGLNRESRSYLVTRNKMAVLGKPVLSFLNNMYASGEAEEPAERQVASGVKPTTISTAIREAQTTFKATLPARVARNSISIQYKAKKDDIERIRKHLKKTWMSASMIGQHTFEYFLERECGK